MKWALTYVFIVELKTRDVSISWLPRVQRQVTSYIPPFMSLAVRESMPILILACPKRAVRKRTGGELSEKVGPVSPGEVRFK